MRAKLQVRTVTPHETAPQEAIEFMAVSDKPYDEGGNSEDNSFSKWTPTANLRMVITNPALFGTLKVGEKYYVDFTKAD